MKQQSFESLMLSFGYHYDLHTIFNDFLIMVIASFSRNMETGLSFMEDEYLEIMNKYDKEKEGKVFPEMLAYLVKEMTDGKIGNNDTSDILGSFFETHISNGRKGQYFTPEPICTMMAQMTCTDKQDESLTPQSIIDPACGSGRMLLASSRILGPMNYYYGIDIDSTCVKICIINLFLNGVFKGEVMQADALCPDNFTVSYITSFVPFGIFRITEKEKSPLWNRVRMSLTKEKEQSPVTFTPLSIKDGTQLSFF